jgi:hypothetical protein
MIQVLLAWFIKNINTCALKNLITVSHCDISLTGFVDLNNYASFYNIEGNLMEG